jgi:hypothetical protein
MSERAVGTRGEIALRLALPADDAAVDRLAGLSERRRPVGTVLVAEVDGVVLAAADADGRVVSDPFLVTLDVTELLRLRAAQLRAAAA